jgi:hypothetical protein
VISALAFRFEQSQSESLATTSSSASVAAPSVNTHIPYRDSKLTRLLQNSLSGNSKMIIILTISKNPIYLSETISTLKFGERARLIRISPQINKENASFLRTGTGKIDEGAVNNTKELEDNIMQLKEQIISLNQIINDLRNDNNSPNPEVPEGTEDLEAAIPLIEQVYYQSQLKKSANLCQVCHSALNKLGKENRLVDPEVNSSSKRKMSPKKGEEEDIEQEENEDQDEAEDDNEEEDEEKEEVIERCAICGLNTQETEELKELTNEDLGFLFSCDGNCGNKFHIRCAGVVGEAGQYILPEGEWYCNDCNVQLSEVAIQKEKEEQKKNAQSPVKSTQQHSQFTPISKENKDTDHSSEEKEEVTTQEDNKDEKTLDESSSPFRSQVHNQTTAPTTHYKEVLIYMNLITNLQQKYNLMRKERNRVLNHFHQEKKLFQQLDYLKNNNIENLLSENSNLVENNELLKMKLLNMEKENEFLQSQISSISSSHNSNTAGDTQSRQSLDKWVSLTESQELKNVFNAIYSMDLSHPRSNQEEEEDQNINDVPQQTPRLRTHPDDSKEAVNNQNSSKENKIHNNFQKNFNSLKIPDDLQEVTAIPRPWIKSSVSGIDAQSNLPLPASENSNTSKKGGSQLPVSPLNNEHEESQSGSSESSRFINPFKNRLSELIGLVQEETSSYQEIRNQYQNSLTNKEKQPKR